MANKLYINGTERALKPGYVVTKHLNETLDTALCIIPQTAEFDIKPFDLATLNDAHYYVSTIRRKIASFSPVRTWNYEIGLISPTIYLQRVILPNRSVTQRFRGTKLSIYNVMQRLITVYAPTLTLSATLQSKTENVTCPEMQWTQPTLYETFNDLLRVVGCVVTMPDYTTVSCFDLNDRGSVIDTTKLNNMEIFQSIEEFSGKLEIDAKNAVYPETNIQTYETLVLKTTQGELMTADNAELILAKPIYSIERIEAVFYDTVNALKRTVDITDRIVEKTVYNAYRSSNTLNVISETDYKRNAIYYTEGTNIIGGFGFNEDGILGIDTRRAINNILTDKLSLSPLQLNANDLFYMGFNVWYISTEDVKFRVERDDRDDDIVMINNQETSHTDLRALAKNNQDVINRIGNPMTTIYARDYIPDLGDTLDDYVLTSLTVRYHTDYTEMSAELTENYVMENMFTAIKNRKRYQQFELASQAFLSEHITEYIVRVTNNAGSHYPEFERYLTHIGQDAYRLKAVVANVLYENESPREFVLNHSSHWLGTNAIRVNVRMDDNYSAGIRIERESIFYVANRYSAVHTPYVDANGEFNAIELLLYKYFNNPNFAIDDMIFADEAYERARNLPLIDPGLELYGDDIIFDTNLLWRYKDNREITSETLQFYFKPDDNIFIKDLFYRHNPLTYQGSTDIDLYVWYSTTETYDENDLLAKGNILSILIRSDNSLRASTTLSQWNALGAASWCVADINGNIYIAVNGNSRSIYFYSDYQSFVVNNNITDINISAAVSFNYLKGDDYFVDDIDISAVISELHVSGDDYHIDDVEIESVVSYGYAGGVSVQLNDIDISAAVSYLYESLGYHPAITDIDIQGAVSELHVSGTDIMIDDVDIYAAVSSLYTGYETRAYTIDDIDIYGVVSEYHTSSFTIANDWQYIGTTGTANLNVTYNSGGAFCLTIAAIDSLLTSNYPPNDRTPGYTARVTRAAIGISCSPLYYFYEIVPLVYEA